MKMFWTLRDRLTDWWADRRYIRSRRKSTDMTDWWKLLQEHKAAKHDAWEREMLLREQERRNAIRAGAEMPHAPTPRNQLR